MAAKKTPAAGKKLRGRMPTKRTINLVLTDEKKIRWSTAVLAIILILLLAVLFSKYLVIDRLNSVYQAQARVDALQDQLDDARALLEEYGDIGNTYAHYTYDGMTAQELGRVDRTAVLKLIIGILPVVEPGPSEADLARLTQNLFREAPETGIPEIDDGRQAARQALLQQLIPIPEYVVNAWSVAENLLTVEVTGQTLERMNQLARRIEQSPIVDSCTITTANKGQDVDSVYPVRARFIVYLQKPEGEIAVELTAWGVTFDAEAGKEYRVLPC